MKVRPATIKDASGMSIILSEIMEAWKSDRPSDPHDVLTRYIEHPDRVQCLVAEEEKGELLGFQSLRRATANNPQGVTIGWGIISTYVKLDMGRRGVGSALFAATVCAAQRAGIPKIVAATIGEKNKRGITYYEAMGFRTYRLKPGAICKCYDVVDR